MKTLSMLSLDTTDTGLCEAVASVTTSTGAWYQHFTCSRSCSAEGQAKRAAGAGTCASLKGAGLCKDPFLALPQKYSLTISETLQLFQIPSPRLSPLSTTFLVVCICVWKYCSWKGLASISEGLIFRSQVGTSTRKTAGCPICPAALLP